MKKIFSENNVNIAAKGLTLLFFFSIFYSLFLISLSIILLGSLGVFYRFFTRKLDLEWTPIILMSIAILPFLLGLIYSNEEFVALKELQYNAAFVFIPISLILLPRFRKKDVIQIFSIYIGFTVISAFPVLWNYFSDYENVTLSLGSGRSISTPIDHVRYSIFVAIAFTFSTLIWLRREQVYILPRWVFLVTSIFLFLLVHVLAVRSGIVLSYLGLLSGGTLHLIERKNYKWLILLWMLVIASPVVAYMFIPSFKNKISYMRYDFSLLKRGEGGNYSDSERLRSLNLGMEILSDHLWLGVGSGDLKETIVNRYRSKYGDKGKAIYPHNQFLKVAAGTGLIGLLFYSLALYLPFFISGGIKNPYMLSLMVIISFSFLVEATLERTYMLALFLFLIGLLYKKTRA